MFFSFILVTNEDEWGIVERPDAFTNEQITQVLELNSHAPKTFEIVAGLDARPEPLTPPQKDRINQGKALVNDFERLRARQVFFLSERNYYIFSSIAYSKSDSTANALKEVEALYANYPFRALAYELAEMYIANNRLTDAANVLISVPVVDGEQDEHNRVLSFYGIYTQLLLDNRTPEELTEAESTELETLVALDGLAGAKARALLIAKTGVDDYIEPRYLPEDVSTELRQENTISYVSSIIQDAGVIDIYPNPTSERTTISYELKYGVEEQEQLQIKIVDMLGKEVFSSKAVCCEGSLTLDIGNLPTGMYVVNVYNSNSKLINAKYLRITK